MRLRTLRRRVRGRHPRIAGRGRPVARVSLALGILLFACQAPAPEAPADPEPEAIRWLARHALEGGRALRAEGRLDAAERLLKRGLARDPQNAKLERELANVLSALGRADEARAAQARADALEPPPAALTQEPVATASGRSLVVLVEATADRLLTEPGRWPDEPVTRALEARLAIRLPGAQMLRADPESVAGAARWLDHQQSVRALSLRVDRADCRFSVKDGSIAVVELRAATAARGGEAPPALYVKSVVEDPAPDACLEEAVARALEEVLASEIWARVAQHGTDVWGSEWSATPLRALFPGIGRRIERELLRGRSLLRAGRLGDAKNAFQEATRIDPKDTEVQAYLDDTERSLVLAREIAARRPAEDDPAVLDPRLSPAQRAAAQVALEREQRRREDLLAALAVLDEDLHAPATAVLDTLRPVEIRTPHAFGPTLARKRAGGRVEARAAYAPDGTVLARYYFSVKGRQPLVREEDIDGDGIADRWIAYRDASRSEIFEDARGRGRPDRRLVFAKGGEPLERIELDLSGDGRPDRVFHYRAGTLLAEESDTDGDGQLDRFDRFDADGQVDVREEDLDGDGSIDVRSEFRGGRLVRRELSDPERTPES